VHLARRCSVAFTGAMAFPNDGRAIRMNGDPDPGDVDRQEGSPVLTAKHTARLDGLPVPTIKSENPVGFRNCVPALKIGQFAAMGLSGPDMAGLGLRRSTYTCFAEKPITVSSRSKQVRGSRG